MVMVDGQSIFWEAFLPKHRRRKQGLPNKPSLRLLLHVLVEAVPKSALKDLLPIKDMTVIHFDSVLSIRKYK